MLVVHFHANFMLVGHIDTFAYTYIDIYIWLYHICIELNPAHSLK